MRLVFLACDMISSPDLEDPCGLALQLVTPRHMRTKHCNVPAHESRFHLQRCVCTCCQFALRSPAGTRPPHCR